MWATGYLRTKTATLWSKNFNSDAVHFRHAHQQAKQLGTKIVPILPTGRLAGIIGEGGAATAGLRKPTVFYNPATMLGEDRTKNPGHYPAAIAHELSEAKYYKRPLGPTNMVVGIDNPDVTKTVAKGMASSIWTSPLQKIKAFRALKGNTFAAHMDPRVLLEESHAIASGQVAPETAARMIALRKESGEYDALHAMGIAYGKTLMEPGSKAYEKARQRFYEKTFVPGNPARPELGGVWNLAPLANQVRERREQAERQQQAHRLLSKLRVK